MAKIVPDPVPQPATTYRFPIGPVPDALKAKALAALASLIDPTGATLEAADGQLVIVTARPVPQPTRDAARHWLVAVASQPSKAVQDDAWATCRRYMVAGIADGGLGLSSWRLNAEEELNARYPNNESVVHGLTGMCWRALLKQAAESTLAAKSTVTL